MLGSGALAARRPLDDDRQPGALRQTNIVRLLAYSSVAQAGFMLVPFAAAAVAGADLAKAFGATLVYLVIYAVMNLGAFAVVIAAARKTRYRRDRGMGRSGGGPMGSGSVWWPPFSSSALLASHRWQGGSRSSRCSAR